MLSIFSRVYENEVGGVSGSLRGVGIPKKTPPPDVNSCKIRFIWSMYLTTWLITTPYKSKIAWSMWTFPHEIRYKIITLVILNHLLFSKIWNNFLCVPKLFHVFIDFHFIYLFNLTFFTLSIWKFVNISWNWIIEICVDLP